MSRRAVTMLVTVVVFTFVMTGIVWVASLVMPWLVDLGTERFGLGPMWAVFILVLLGCAYVAYWRPARMRT